MQNNTRRSIKKYVRPSFEVLEDRLVLDTWSAGLLGANAHFLTTPSGALLDGSGIWLGQIEVSRPNKPGLDTLSHPDVSPSGVYLNNRASSANRNISAHALQVAGVMIANGTQHRGVAPNSALFSSALPEGTNALRDEQNVVLAAQFLGERIDAINHSYGLGGPFTVNTDGSSLVSRGLDWWGRHELNVIAGSEMRLFR